MGVLALEFCGIKFKLSRVEVCVVVRYGPSEEYVEERDRFWKEMERVLDRVGNGYRLCFVEDLNRWIGDKTRVRITGAFGIPGENDNGSRVVELCAERGLCVDKTYFKHSSLHKYTSLARGQIGMEVINIIHLVLLYSDMLRYVQGVRAVREMG